MGLFRERSKEVANRNMERRIISMLLLMILIKSIKEKINYGLHRLRVSNLST